MAKTTKSRDRGARAAQPRGKTGRDSNAARNDRVAARRAEAAGTAAETDVDEVRPRAIGRLDPLTVAADRVGRSVDKIEKPAPVSDLAAPGKVHQPVKESGAGTPSADARPGRSSFQGPIEPTEEELGTAIKVRMGDKLRVQATMTGHYDNIRRRAGEVFDIHGYVDADGKVVPATQVFSRRWMKRVADKTARTGTKGPNQVIQERHDEIFGARVTRRAGGGTVGADEDLNPIGAED